MSKNTGGPAIPAGIVRQSRPIHDPGAGFVVTDIAEPRHEGMSLRDYFAAKAMQALIASPNTDHSVVFSSVADVAYRVADAMLAEREKGNPK